MQKKHKAIFKRRVSTAHTYIVSKLINLTEPAVDTECTLGEIEEYMKNHPTVDVEILGGGRKNGNSFTSNEQAA